MGFMTFLKNKGYMDLLESIDYLNDVIYPKQEDVFRAFKLTPYNQVKVVIFGQDPYHTPKCANGLAFSVPNDVKIPPSLKNIFKELKKDLNISRSNPDLSDWASQGVLLLNATLTVKQGSPRSHYQKWSNLGKDLIGFLNQKDKPIIYVLWGNDARKNKSLIDPKHYIIESVHPSPLSAYHGFFNSKPFSKINELCKLIGYQEINW